MRVLRLAGGKVVSKQPAKTGETPSGVSDSGKAAVEESAASSAGGQVARKLPVRSSVAPVCTSGGKDPVLETVEKVLQDGEHPALVESMAKLLKAQTEMLAA